MKFNLSQLLLLLLSSQSETVSLRGVNYTSTDPEPCTCGNGRAKIWGPGGPHTALIPAAELFNAERNVGPDEAEIEICYGPEHTWRESAMDCASGLTAAAEMQTAGLIRVYRDILDPLLSYGEIATPVTMHGSTLLVNKGNPKNITGLDDILARDDVGLVIVDGSYHDTITSGTALWEDVIGRTKRLEDTVKLRQSICYVASGAGDARNHLTDSESSGCDAWIYWHDWAVGNQDIIDEIEMPKELQIFRDLNVIPTTNPGGNVVNQFISFLLDSPEADATMQEAG